MGFNVDAILIKDYNYSSGDHMKGNFILKSIDLNIRRYGFFIEKNVEREEYEKNTTSKSVNKYIKVRDMKEGGHKLKKVGTGKYDSEIFASVRYAFVNISTMDNGITIIWPCFHSKLIRQVDQFCELTSQIAKYISTLYRDIEIMKLSANSFSRHSDLFQLFINGSERVTMGGKSALTEVKTTYGIDVNSIMMNIDKNNAIYYSALDYADLVKEKAEQKKRYNMFLKQDKTVVTNKEDGSNLIETFEKENDQIIANIDKRLEIVSRSLSSNPIGDILFFKIDKINYVNTSMDEREFGLI